MRRRWSRLVRERSNMKLRCKDAEILICRYLAHELAPKEAKELDEHMQECVGCRRTLSFHKDIQSRIAGTPKLPPGLAARAQELLEDTVPASVSLWSRLLQGNTTMKRLTISTTALAVLLAGAMILPNKAAASSPLKVFKAMRSAFSRAANQGLLAVTVRAKANGDVDVSGTLNGVTLPPSFPLKAVSKQDDDIVTVEVTVDFDPAHYSSIRHGKTPNSLQMVYKGKPNSTINVELDPKTQLPSSWTTEELFEEVVPTASDEIFGEVVRTTASEPSTTPAPSKANGSRMWARIRLRIGQEATVSMRSFGN